MAGTDPFIARLHEATTTTESMQQYLLQLAFALLLADTAVRNITRISSTLIEHLLLKYFPALWGDWCIVHVGDKTAILQRTQKFCAMGICAAAIVLGCLAEYVQRYRLRDCILSAIPVHLAVQALAVISILFTQSLLWVGHHLAILTDWEPTYHHNDCHSKPKFSGPNMPRKHPSSIRMVRHHSCLPAEIANNARHVPCDAADSHPAHQHDIASPTTHDPLKQFQDFAEELDNMIFIAREYNTSTLEYGTAIYHSITSRAKFWKESFEELRLQHYTTQDTNPSSVLVNHTLPRSPESLQVADDEDPRHEQGLFTSSLRHIASPKWLASRSFREQVFDSLSSSTTSAGQGQGATKDNADAYPAAGAGVRNDSPTPAAAKTSQLLMGQGEELRRSFA